MTKSNITNLSWNYCNANTSNDRKRKRNKSNATKTSAGNEKIKIVKEIAEICIMIVIPNEAVVIDRTVARKAAAVCGTMTGIALQVVATTMINIGMIETEMIGTIGMTEIDTGMTVIESPSGGAGRMMMIETLDEEEIENHRDEMCTETLTENLQDVMYTGIGILIEKHPNGEVDLQQEAGTIVLLPNRVATTAKLVAMKVNPPSEVLAPTMHTTSNLVKG